jgi:hypothetical protein
LRQNFTTKKVQRLNLGGSLPNGRDAHVTKNLFLFVGLDVAVAAVDLDSNAGSLEPGFCEETLR